MGSGFRGPVWEIESILLHSVSANVFLFVWCMVSAIFMARSCLIPVQNGNTWKRAGSFPNTPLMVWPLSILALDAHWWVWTRNWWLFPLFGLKFVKITIVCYLTWTCNWIVSHIGAHPLPSACGANVRRNNRKHPPLQNSAFKKVAYGFLYITVSPHMPYSIRDYWRRSPRSQKNLCFAVALTVLW